MQEAVTLLRDKAAKAELKVQRAEKALESARTELSDLQTALRVLETLSGESGGPSPSSGPSAPVAERQSEILKLLGVGQKQGHSPAELFTSYESVAKEGITIETFRTTVWRMKDREFGDFVVRGDDGVYWKEWLVEPAKPAPPPIPPAPLPVPPRPAPPPPPLPNDDAWHAAGVHNVPPSGGGFADDLDGDIPF